MLPTYVGGGGDRQAGQYMVSCLPHSCGSWLAHCIGTFVKQVNHIEVGEMDEDFTHFNFSDLEREMKEVFHQANY